MIRHLQLLWVMLTRRDVVWDYTEIEEFLEHAGDWGPDGAER